jgi:hypothetical protein
LALFSDQSLRCAYFFSPRITKLIEERLARGEVDLVHAEHLKSASMIDDMAGKVPIVFDAVDCISMFEVRRHGLLRNPLARVFSKMEGGRMKRAEIKTIELFDRVTISSPVDKNSYPAPDHLKSRVEVVPNGIDLEYFGFKKYPREVNLVVFCAKLDYFPNEDAALYLARSIWPLLQKRRPHLHLEIIGSQPPRSVRQLNGRNNIRVIPSVPDIRPYLGRASVAVCPIRAQAGTQNKILEAMALGVPVVATRVCCPGLGVEPRKHLVVGDSPQEFASAIEEVLDDEGLRNSLIDGGRAFVEGDRDWEKSVESLCKVYDEAISDFQRRTHQAYGASEVLCVPVRDRHTT